jgi:penicillin-binding protein 2
MMEGILHSCNGYFFSGFRQIIDGFEYTQPQIGLDTMNYYLRQFGLGGRLGIDYPNENAGNIATSAYYDKIYPKKLGGWRSPTVMSIGIGQGEEQLTTLQMANIACSIANKGYWYPPHLAKEFKDRKALIPIRFRTKRQINIAPEYFQIIIDGMAECVNRGTATIARIPDIQVCGKTGTSQNPHGEDHSVFVAFAPKENPKIAIAVFVENAGFGATYAAPIASLMIEKYLNGTIRPDRIAVETKMMKANLVDKYLAEAYGIQKPRPGNEDNRDPAPATMPGDTLPPTTIVPKEGN